MAGNGGTLSSQQLLQLLSAACSPSQSAPQTAVVFQPVGVSNVSVNQTNQGQLHGASVSVPPVSHRDTLSLKVINPKKKKEYKVYQLDGLRQVTSEEMLRECIFNGVGKDVVRYDLDFEVGYFEGTTRMSFPSDEFEDRLHRVLADGKYLWCYGLTGTDSESDEEAPATKRKKKKNTMANSVEIKADRIDALANELKQKHGEKYSRMQYKLWAEVVDRKKHTSLEEPPLGSIWNRQQKDKSKKEGSMDQMATAFTSLANSVSAALQPMHGNQTPNSHSGGTDTTQISPDTKIDLQGKLLHNLQLLHSMYEKGAVTTQQFEKRRDSLMQQLDDLD